MHVQKWPLMTTKKYFSEKYEDCDLKNDINKMYTITKKQLGWKTGGTPKSFNWEGKIVNSPKKLAEIQNEFFIQKVEKLKEKIPCKNDLPDPLCHLENALKNWKGYDKVEKLIFEETTTEVVKNLIKKMKNSGSFGHDRLDAKSIKIACDELTPHITYVINLSIRKSKFLNKWRIGKVTPLHKGKNSDEMSPKSYRPISLLPIISKLAEKIIQLQIVHHFDQYSMWNLNQHGYRRKRSTTTTMLEIADMLFAAADEREIADILTIDESAAFDTVETDILIDKLELYKVGDEARDWIQTYLTCRTQYVSIGGQDSAMRAVKSGVPQGSVLGPVLFTIYTNEISQVTKNTECENIEHTNTKTEKLFGQNCNNCGTTTAYADDSTHIIRHKDRNHNQQQLATNLQSIANFLQSNNLSVNQSKTQVLETMVHQRRCRTQGNPPMLAVLNENNQLKIIQNEKYIKLLGLNLSQNLNWTPHLLTGDLPILSQIKQKLGTLSHLKKQLPRNARQTLANGIILSRIQYMAPVWGGLPKSRIKQIQTIMNTTARFITGYKRRTATTKLMSACNWLYASELIQYHTLVTLWTTIMDTQENYFQDKIIKTGQYLLETTTPRLKTTNMSFRWRSIRQWNNLPLTVRTSKNIETFKRSLRKHIITERTNGKPNQ